MQRPGYESLQMSKHTSPNHAGGIIDEGSLQLHGYSQDGTYSCHTKQDLGDCYFTPVLENLLVCSHGYAPERTYRTHGPSAQSHLYAGK